MILFVEFFSFIHKSVHKIERTKAEAVVHIDFNMAFLYHGIEYNDGLIQFYNYVISVYERPDSLEVTFGVCVCVCASVSFYLQRMPGWAMEQSALH